MNVKVVCVLRRRQMKNTSAWSAAVVFTLFKRSFYQWHFSDVHQLIASVLIVLPANNDNQLYQSSCDTFACHSPKNQTTGMILCVSVFFTIVRPCTVRCSDIVNRTVRFGVVVIDCILRFGSVRVSKRGNPTVRFGAVFRNRKSESAVFRNQESYGAVRWDFKMSYILWYGSVHVWVRSWDTLNRW